MLWERASSTNIKEVGFDPTTSELQVRFRSGATYRYVGIPESLWQQFKETGFSGRFLNTDIKGLYEYERLI